MEKQRVLLKLAEGSQIEGEIPLRDSFYPEIIRWRDYDFRSKSYFDQGRAVYSQVQSSVVLNWDPNEDGIYRT